MEENTDLNRKSSGKSNFESDRRTESVGINLLVFSSGTIVCVLIWWGPTKRNMLSLLIPR